MAETLDVQQVAADFDRIALLPEYRWNHNNHYHKFLLRQVPANCQNALEVGCGKGEFARRLAQQSQHVLGIDLSANMIRLAQAQTVATMPIDFRVADVMTKAFEPESFDFIASIATLHHMPLAPVLHKLRAALRPGGVLAVLDLYQEKTRTDFIKAVLPNVAAVPVHFLLNWFYNGRPKPSPEEQAAWQAHGERDEYLSLTEVRRISADVMPGAVVRRHLLWRYSLVWRKPTA